jgi:hypothetical protein
MAHHRIVPDRLRLARCVRRADRVRPSEFEAGPAWQGDAERLESPTEELHRLEVEEIIGGYYRQVGGMDGGRSPATLTVADACMAVMPDRHPG